MGFNSAFKGLIYALDSQKINILPCKEKVIYEQIKENISTDKLSIVYAMSFIVPCIPTSTQRYHTPTKYSRDESEIS